MKQLLIIPFLLFCLEMVSQPVFIITAEGDLFSVDLGHCSSRYIGSTGLPYADIAFTPDGNLWGFVDSNIYKIDTISANPTIIGNTGLDGISLVALNDSTLLVESDSRLFGISINDASSYYIDTIGYWALGDLTWYDNDLYLNTSFRLIKIELNSSGTDVMSVTPVNNVSEPTINAEGTATSTFIGAYNSIVGFSGRTAFKICQLDGTFHLLCDSLTSEIISGGASVRLPPQLPEPAHCQLETSMTDFISERVEAEIHPNPVSKSSSIQIRLSNNFSFPLTVSIINIEGNTLYTRNELSATNTMEIDLDRLHLTSGLYVVVIKSSTLQLRSLIFIE